MNKPQVHITKDLTWVDTFFICGLFAVNTMIIMGAVEKRQDPCREIGMTKQSVLFDRFTKTVKYECLEEPTDVE